jgi:hypothetical protein
MHSSRVLGKDADNGNEPQNPGLQGGLTEKPGSTETIATEQTPEDGKAHEFNEQTNYVPKKTIITVSPLTSRGHWRDRR